MWSFSKDSVFEDVINVVGADDGLKGMQLNWTSGHVVLVKTQGTDDRLKEGS